MKKSKDMFLAMREGELSTLFDATFTKKEAVETGIKNIDIILESGNIGSHELMAQIVRYKAVLDSMEARLRDKLPHEKVKIMGVEFTPSEGGYSLNYEEDCIYCELKQNLDHRVELLKLAQKQDVLDLYGNEVPRVSKSPRKSSITIKF